MALATEAMAVANEIRYVAIGDSYSIGEGTTPDRSWPALLTRELQSSGLLIQLVANPSVTGWTTQDAMEKELPVFREVKPNFATLLLGVNDWVQGVTPENFRSNFRYLLSEMLDELQRRDRLLVVTIPDFSVTPDAPKYARGRDISKGLAEFNQIVAQEANESAVPIVDILPVSQQMRDDPSLVAADRLHPSAKAYAQWTETILPTARELLLGGAK